MTGKPVTSVEFNDGTNEDVFALVIKDDGGDKLNLQVIPESGDPYIRNGVVRREKADYDNAGGGDTWHES